MSPRALVVAIALLLPIGASAQERIDGTHAGSWFDPATPGHGFSFQLLPDRRGLLYWYTYDTAGRPIFLFGQTAQPIAVDATEVRFETFFLEGMRFPNFNPTDRRMHPWGSMTMRFASCGRASLNFTGAASAQSPNAPSGSGTINLVKLADSHAAECGPTASLPGLWLGEVTDGPALEGLDHDDIVVALPDGTLAYFDDDDREAEGGLGRWSIEGNTVRATVRICPARSVRNCDSMNMTGSIIPKVAFNGDFIESDGKRGTFSFERANPALRPRTLADLAGSFDAEVAPRVTMRMTVGANGEFSATDPATRCVYQGRMTQPAFGRNVFAINLAVSGCPASGSVNGAVVLTDSARFGDNRRLTVLIDGLTHGPALIQGHRVTP